MKRLAGLLLCFSGMVVFSYGQQSGNSSLNSLTAKEKKDGWKLLFDGKTKNGWHTYGSTSPEDAWNVQDNALHLTAAAEGGDNKGHGDLVTNEEYDNYDLKLDWKIAPKGNSGVILFIHDDKAKYPQTYNTGLEMQVLDNDGHADGKIHKHRSGDLYDLVACSTETVKPVGEWNQVEVISKNGNLQFFLNGTKVVETTLWNDEWKKMVAASKFKTMPDFGTYKKGKISLQDHNNEVWYRNIRIRKL